MLALLRCGCFLFRPRHGVLVFPGSRPGVGNQAFVCPWLFALCFAVEPLAGQVIIQGIAQRLVPDNGGTGVVTVDVLDVDSILVSNPVSTRHECLRSIVVPAGQFAGNRHAVSDGFAAGFLPERW